MTKNILVPNVAIGLLQRQYQALNQMVINEEFNKLADEDTEALSHEDLMKGVINMLEEMLNIEENFDEQTR